jgi:hypothetical protein
MTDTFGCDFRFFLDFKLFYTGVAKYDEILDFLNDELEICNLFSLLILSVT